MNDEDYFFLMCERMNKIPSDEELDKFLELVKNTIRVKAFIQAMQL
jgi:hypothetical protein